MATSTPRMEDRASQSFESEAGSTAKDVAIQMVGEKSHAIDPAVAARAVRKIDWFLIPAMTIGVSSPCLYFEMWLTNVIS